MNKLKCMSEVLKFERRVQERYDDRKLKIEKKGNHSFRITTASSDEYDFRNRIKAERFDLEFISQLNQYLSPEQQLDINDKDVFRELVEIRKEIEENADSFEIKMTFRMTN